MVDSDESELARRDSDASLKLMVAFQQEIEVMRHTGACPPALHIAILLLRAALPIDTQDIEGRNSQLQAMSRGAAYMALARASDRMQLDGGARSRLRSWCSCIREFWRRWDRRGI